MHISETISSKHMKEYIKSSLKINPETPYKRDIVKIEWMSEKDCPIVYHTASLVPENIDIKRCESFDFSMDNKPLPVIYVLPYPHVNRVKYLSEIPSRMRKLAQKKHGYSHSYLTIQSSESTEPYAQIRLGSTMNGAFLLVLKNTGGIFKVDMIAEGNIAYSEHISIYSLPVANSFSFKESSPIGLATGGRLETHSSISIPNPDLIGYNLLTDTVLKQFSPEDQQKLNNLVSRLFLAKNSGENPLYSQFPELNESV